MNKYELKYFIEQQTAAVDRLTDVLGNQSNHINDLWQKNKDLQETIKNQGSYIARLRVKLHRIEMTEDAQEEKNIKDLLGENTDN
jgi:septal ring factor EnvC (AmiA/AmiB activator)|tara:strand:- start:70 stop:324 length:255 start_codon:yes stop_codon:yes gene_type:complete